MQRSEWKLAAESFHEAVRMAHEVGQRAVTSEVYLALAQFHLKELSNPRQQAQQLAAARDSITKLLPNCGLRLVTWGK